MEKASAKVPKDEQDKEDAVTLSNGKCDSEPKAKMAKLSNNNHSSLVDLTLNPSYTKITQSLTTQWSNAGASQKTSDFKHKTTGAEIFADPFQICILPDFLQHKASTRKLVDEMVEKVSWSRKQLDLYEFYQSTDLSNMADCKLLTSFLQMLRRNVRPWLEKMTNLKLDYVSASCSMYTCGDYLLVHDDLLKDRQIAFIYYLSPWDDAEQWSEAQGGCLEIFSSDDQCFPQFPVQRKISPRNNQFAFFKVGSRSFHQVGEVTTFDYPRLTINGWFHGASNEDVINDSMRPFTKLNFQQPNVTEDKLTLLLNEVYLKQNTRQSIQKRIEDNSEICLYEFFRREIFEETLKQLLNDKTLVWRRKGPANVQNFEVLDMKSSSKAVAQLMDFFTSTEMFELLHDYTDLDLAGSNVMVPTCSVELQRWSHGNYTILGDCAVCEENILDLTYYLNAAEGAGVITYLSPDAEGSSMLAHASSDNYMDADDRGEDDDDSVLLTITPVDNSLNIVYRCESTTKFTKYVSRNTPLEKGPVFVISCSYVE